MSPAPSAGDEHVLATQRADDLRHGLHAMEADEQPLAAHAVEDVGEAVDQRRQPLLQIEARLAHMIEEAVREHDVEHGIADRHGERVAAEGGAMRSGRHALRRLVGGEAGAEREAATDALGRCEDVRRDAGPLIGEELAGAADAGLHLVHDQQQPLGVAERPKLAQEAVRKGTHAALALQRLDHHRRRLGGHRRLDERDVAKGDLVEAVRLGAEAFQIFLLAAGGERRQRAAMEGALDRQDAIALGMAVHIVVAPRRLDGAFVRLGARIGEKDAIGEARRDEPVGEPLLARDAEEVRGMPELAGLLGQGRDQGRIGMAERIDRDARREVEIGLAVRGIEPRALPSLERQRRTRKRIEEAAGCVRSSGCGGGHVPSLGLSAGGREAQKSKVPPEAVAPGSTY